MGKRSKKENKNRYQLRREELGLTREEASELLVTLPPERIERIENEKVAPHPEDILAMARGYKAPHLCNYYCAHDCPIGRQYVPEVEPKDLSQIVLDAIAALNAAARKKDRLIEIAVDGAIAPDEMEDFVRIQAELEKLSVAVESLQLWTEEMIAAGRVDRETYQALTRPPEA